MARLRPAPLSPLSHTPTHPHLAVQYTAEPVPCLAARPLQPMGQLAGTIRRTGVAPIAWHSGIGQQGHMAACMPSPLVGEGHPLHTNTTPACSCQRGAGLHGRCRVQGWVGGGSPKRPLLQHRCLACCGATVPLDVLHSSYCGGGGGANHWHTWQGLLLSGHELAHIIQPQPQQQQHANQVHPFSTSPPEAAQVP